MVSSAVTKLRTWIQSYRSVLIEKNIIDSISYIKKKENSNVIYFRCDSSPNHLGIPSFYLREAYFDLPRESSKCVTSFECSVVIDSLVDYH